MNEFSNMQKIAHPELTEVIKPLLDDSTIPEPNKLIAVGVVASGLSNAYVLGRLESLRKSGQRTPPNLIKSGVYDFEELTDTITRQIEYALPEHKPVQDEILAQFEKAIQPYKNAGNELADWVKR